VEHPEFKPGKSHMAKVFEGPIFRAVIKDDNISIPHKVVMQGCINFPEKLSEVLPLIPCRDADCDIQHKG
jgi:hypothetical protein